MPRGRRIGPHGKSTQVVWTDHAKQRLQERVLPHGPTIEAIENLIRFPNAGRHDELDPDIDPRGEKYRRWIRVPLREARGTVRIVYTASADRTDGLIVVSVVVEDTNTHYG